MFLLRGHIKKTTVLTEKHDTPFSTLLKIGIMKISTPHPLLV